MVLTSSEKAKEDIAGPIGISVDGERTIGTVKEFVSTKIGVDVTTGAAGLACVILIDDQHHARGTFSCFVEESPLELEMRPSQHGSRRLAVQFPFLSNDHVLCFKGGKQNELI